MGPVDHQILQVGQSRDTVAADTDLPVDQRPVVGRHQVLHGTLELSNERGGHPLRTRPYEDGVGLHVDPVGVRRVHPPVHVQQRYSLAIHGDLYLLVFRCLTVEAASGGVLESHLEDVLAVGREIVDHGDSPPRSPGCTLNAVPLSCIARVGVRRRAGTGVGIPDGQPTDLAGRGQVGAHERRREHLDVCDIVEIGALRIEGQVVAGVHVEGQEVADRAAVLGSIEPLEGSTAGIGVGRGSLVDPGFQCLD